MTGEQKKEFTMRITQSNRTELLIVVYDILFVYLDDAQTMVQERDREGLKEAIRGAQKVLTHLESNLDFKYEISKSLYPLYGFSKRQLSMALVRFTAKEIEETKKILKPIYDSYVKLAKEDTSEPLMKNTQQVFAGMTYGKEDLTETYGVSDTSRGFFA